MSAPAAAIPATRCPTPAAKQNVLMTGLNTAYSLIMTPITFVSFIFSLVLIDYYHSSVRTRKHGENSSTLLDWLHHIVYKPAPYKYVAVKQAATSSSSPVSVSCPTTPLVDKDEDGKAWFLRTKQKQEVRMEVEEAFEMRGFVLVVMGVLMVLGTCTVWILGSAAFRFLLKAARG
ncbi:hypothetical protein MKZ38_003099 [Zalerion maritima]|uniref:Uncharacterized protein n=1 Tax=Zalerion maritima TaxID=339359 RepID=A0AAD5WV86_9PEZI|nr:hypothetical protein MKZ38_003099 [Zalerion maritima]